MEAKDDIKKTLRTFITENFLPQSGTDSFLDSDSFMEKGIIDSTGVLELLELIEERFSIKVEDEEVVPENLDSLERLTVYISRKQGYVAP